MKKSKDDEIENKKSFNKLFQIKQIIIKRIETKPKKKQIEGLLWKLRGPYIKIKEERERRGMVVNTKLDFR